MSRVGAGWLALCAGACFPTPTHGPRVDPGFLFGGTESFPIALRHYDTGLFGSGPFDVAMPGVNVAYGWRGSDALPALRVGGEFMLLTSAPDVYVQIPKALSGFSDIGVGATASLGLGLAGARLAYFQAGVQSDSGRGLFVSQGLIHEDPFAGSNPNEHLRDDGWLMSVAYQWRGRNVDWQAFVAGVRGRPFRQDCSNNPFVDCRGLRRPYAAYIGLTWEAPKSRAAR